MLSCKFFSLKQFRYKFDINNIIIMMAGRIKKLFVSLKIGKCDLNISSLAKGQARVFLKVFYD